MEVTTESRREGEVRYLRRVGVGFGREWPDGFARGFREREVSVCVTRFPESPCKPTITIATTKPGKRLCRNQHEHNRLTGFGPSFTWAQALLKVTFWEARLPSALALEALVTGRGGERDQVLHRILQDFLARGFE